MLLLERAFPPDIRVEKEARTLLKVGHEVFLLSLRKEDLSDEEVVDGIKVIRHQLPRKRPLPIRAWNYFRLQLFFIHPLWTRVVEDTIKKYQIEALHVHDLPSVTVGLNVARKFNLPLVADLHENYPEDVRVSPMTWKGNLVKPITIKLWKQTEKYCVRQANRIITVVDEAKEHYVHDYGVSPQKVTVVMNAEDLDYFCSLPVKEEIVSKYQPYVTIAYIGGFGHHRGIQTTISAMPKIMLEIPRSKLLLIGSGNNEDELRQLARKEGVEEAVEFVGWQPFTLVPSYIAASQVCLVPHIASGFTDTTVPHKIFQYMAMGKPVITSSAKPLARIIKETGAGIVYPSGDAATLAETVIRIYQDEELAAKLRQAAKIAVTTKYNWQREEEKLITLYQDLERDIK